MRGQMMMRALICAAPLALGLMSSGTNAQVIAPHSDPVKPLEQIAEELSQEIVHDIPVHIGQSKIATTIPIGKAFMIHAE